MDISYKIKILLTIELDQESFEQSILVHKDFISDFAIDCRKLYSFRNYITLYKYFQRKFINEPERISLIYVQYLEKVQRSNTLDSLISITGIFIPLLDEAIKEKYGN